MISVIFDTALLAHHDAFLAPFIFMKALRADPRRVFCRHFESVSSYFGSFPAEHAPKSFDKLTRRRVLSLVPRFLGQFLRSFVCFLFDLLVRRVFGNDDGVAPPELTSPDSEVVSTATFSADAISEFVLPKMPIAFERFFDLSDFLSARFEMSSVGTPNSGPRTNPVCKTRARGLQKGIQVFVAMPANAVGAGNAFDPLRR